MARGLKGVENVYTQHQPLLGQPIENIVRGHLCDVDYPFVGNHFQQGRPQDVIIFTVGGTTYEDARTVASKNASQNGTRVLLGGSVVHNSSSGLSEEAECVNPGKGSPVMGKLQRQSSERAKFYVIQKCGAILVK